MFANLPNTNICQFNQFKQFNQYKCLTNQPQCWRACCHRQNTPRWPEAPEHLCSPFLFCCIFLSICVIASGEHLSPRMGSQLRAVFPNIIIIIIGPRLAFVTETHFYLYLCLVLNLNLMRICAQISLFGEFWENRTPQPWWWSW